MRTTTFLLAGFCAALAATPAFAQDAMQDMDMSMQGGAAPAGRDMV